MHIYNHRTASSGSSSGTSSSVPTGPITGALAWPARPAADRAGRGGAAATAAAAAVCCSMIVSINIFEEWWLGTGGKGLLHRQSSGLRGVPRSLGPLAGPPGAWEGSLGAWVVSFLMIF